MNFVNSIIDFFEVFVTTSSYDFLMKILCAIFIGLIIGFEREITGHKGGIKTNILICLGSCIFCSLEALLGLDDMRIAANVVTGVGFLCSGFIFKTGLSVNGLGTAATLWCAAGLGIFIAWGYRAEAFVVSIVLFVVNLGLAKLGNKIKPLKGFDDSKNEDDYIYNYNIVCLKESLNDVKKTIINNSLAYDSLIMNELTTKNITEDKIRILVSFKSDTYKVEDIEGVLEGVDSLKGVLSSGWTRQEED